MPGIIECDHYYCRESLRFLFTQKHLLFLQKSCTFSSSIGTSSALFFSRHIDDFRGTEINLESPSCAVDARGARGKHDVYSGTFGTQIKARPFMTGKRGCFWPWVGWPLCALFFWMAYFSARSSFSGVIKPSRPVD